MTRCGGKTRSLLSTAGGGTTRSLLSTAGGGGTALWAGGAAGGQEVAHPATSKTPRQMTPSLAPQALRRLRNSMPCSTVLAGWTVQERTGVVIPDRQEQH